jgi:hypothetical protein
VDPSSENEIMRALDEGSARETATFDAKQQLPPPGKNKDLARDLCAMTVDGGAPLYGVGGSHLAVTRCTTCSRSRFSSTPWRRRRIPLVART